MVFRLSGDYLIPIGAALVMHLLVNIRIGKFRSPLYLCLLYTSHLHVFIEQLETGKHNLGQRTVILYVARLEAIQPIQSSHYNLARMQSFEGTLVEVTTLQPVLVIIGIATEHGLLRLAVNGQHHVYQFSSGADPYNDKDEMCIRDRDGYLLR